MAEAARMAPQRIKVSSKRQITIPAKAYKDMGFTEYALIEQTDEGLLIKPLKAEDEGMSLDVLRRLIAEGYEGEALVERYAAVCPHVIKFEDARACTAVDGGDASEAKRLNEAANSVPVSPPSRRATCLARSPAGISLPKATWMFASSTMGRPLSPCSRCPSSKSTSNVPAGAPSTW